MLNVTKLKSQIINIISMDNNQTHLDEQIDEINDLLSSSAHTDNIPNNINNMDDMDDMNENQIDNNYINVLDHIRESGTTVSANAYSNMIRALRKTNITEPTENGWNNREQYCSGVNNNHFLMLFDGIMYVIMVEKNGNEINNIDNDNLNVTGIRYADIGIMSPESHFYY